MKHFKNYVILSFSLLTNVYQKKEEGEVIHLQNHTLSATIATRSWSCVCISLRFGNYGWYLNILRSPSGLIAAWLQVAQVLGFYGLSLGKMIGMHFDLWWGLPAQPHGIRRGQSLCVGMLSQEFNQVYWFCSSEYPNASLEAFNNRERRLRHIKCKAKICPQYIS